MGRSQKNKNKTKTKKTNECTLIIICLFLFFGRKPVVIDGLKPLHSPPSLSILDAAIYSSRCDYDYDYDDYDIF